MKQLTFTLLFSLIATFAFSQTVVDIVVQSAEHDTLEAAVLAAKLDDDLSGAGPFTLFAPTDDAFANLPAGTLDTLLNDPEGALANILRYHVLGSKQESGDLSDGQTAPTLLGPDIAVRIENGDVFINDAQVTMRDIQATNGVVHVIDAVLTPPTVVDIIVNSPVHTTLETAVGEAKLVDALSGDGPFTVFAPTDEAFGDLPMGMLDSLLADPEGDLANVLLYHVLGSKQESTDLSDGQTAATLLGPDIAVRIENGNVFINDAQVTIANIQAANGVVHVLNAVLTPPTVVDIIVNSPVHTTLETAVGEAKLVDALSGDGPFTVFAPTDEAFGDLPMGMLDSLLADPEGDLANVLLYHVLGDKVESGDLINGQVAKTLLGPNVAVRIENGDVFINDAQVTIANIQAVNGVVHVINAVLTPPTILDIVVNSPIHTTLETAVGLAKLEGALSGDGPLTLFAPTDDAFGDLPDGLLTDLTNDPEGDLQKVLLYHALGSKEEAGDLSDGQVVTTLQEEDVTVRLENGNVFINDALVTIADIQAVNGVIHVINAVLIPPSLTSVRAEPASNIGIVVRPNPTSDQLYIEMPRMDAGQAIDVQMLNTLGQSVRSWQARDAVEQVSVGDLTAGIYFLRFAIEGQIYFQQVVVK
ncbi:MAG: fasciclin domain-containing protein [Bacteroidota bacterium]